MNRRQFIKAAAPVVAIPAIAITCKYEDDEKGEKESKHDWPYVVYCYERQQGEWVFTTNTRGNFAHQREYMIFEDEDMSGYVGFMHDGRLRFQTIDDACEFVETHVRTKDDINLLDSIYDVYYKSTHPDSNEIQVAHYWFNGDTGRQIHWVADKHYTDYSKVEFA